MAGFSFNGSHSENSWGLVFQSKNRQLMPQRRRRTIEIPGRDGIFDFNGDTLQNRNLEVHCFFVGSSIAQLRVRVRQMAAILFAGGGQGNLSFDDEPDVYYRAKLVNQVDVDQIANYSEFTLTFECEPYAYYINAGGAAFHQWTIDNRGTGAVPGATQIAMSAATTASNTFNNIGSANCSPVISISGSMPSSVTITNVTTSKTMTISGGLNASSASIDCDAMTVAGLPGLMRAISGEFISFQPGNNLIRITGSPAFTATFNFAFRCRFL